MGLKNYRKIFRLFYWDFTKHAVSIGWILSLITIPVIIYLLVNPNSTTDKKHDSRNVFLIGVIDATSKTKLQFSTNNYETSKPPLVNFIYIKRKSQAVDSLLNTAKKMLSENRLNGVMYMNDTNYTHPEILLSVIPDEEILSEINNRVALSNVEIVKKHSDNSAVEIIKPSYKIVRRDVNGNLFEFVPQAFLSNVTYYTLLFFILLSFIAGIVIRSFQEEKSSKLIEVLLSMADIGELIVGKYTATILLAAVQGFVWLLVSYLMSVYYSSSALSISFLAEVFIIYFAGILFYVSVYMSLGSKIFRESSVQYILTLISLVVFIPMIFAQVYAVNGDVSIMNSLGYVPLFTPITSIIGLLSGSMDSKIIVYQNLLLLLWSAVLMIPLIRSQYSPFGMFGSKSKAGKSI